jgi:2'-5' RNA ligase superfamily
LMLVLPDIDALVGRWRERHDPYAAAGVPAHTTVRSPFVPPERWRDVALLDALRPLVPVDVTLARIEDRPGALVVVIEPDSVLRELTAMVSAALPELPPHKDGRLDLAYHVTAVRTADRVVRAEAALALEGQLPLRVTGTELWAGAQTADGYLHAVLAAS